MTPNPPRLDVLQAAGALHVEHCDVPVEMTLGEWRRHCADQQRAETTQKRGKLRRVLRRAA